MPLPPIPPLFPYTTLFRSHSLQSTVFSPQSSVHSLQSTVFSPQSSAHSLQSTVFSPRSEEHTSELKSRVDLVCRLLLEKKNSHAHSSKLHGFPTSEQPTNP